MDSQKWVILFKNEITDKRRGQYTPTPLIGSQFIIRVNSDNEDALENFLRFDASEIDKIRKTGTEVENKAIVNTNLVYPTNRLENGGKLEKRVHGLNNGDAMIILAGQTGKLTYTCGYNIVKMKSITIIGVKGQVKAGFKVLAPDNSTILNQFGFDVPVGDSWDKFESSYPGHLYKDLIIELSLTNNGTESELLSARVDLDEIVGAV